MLKDKLSIGRNDLLLFVTSATPITGGQLSFLRTPGNAAFYLGVLMEHAFSRKMCPWCSVRNCNIFFGTHTILGRS